MDTDTEKEVPLSSPTSGWLGEMTKRLFPWTDKNNIPSDQQNIDLRDNKSPLTGSISEEWLKGDFSKTEDLKRGNTT